MTDTMDAEMSPLQEEAEAGNSSEQPAVQEEDPWKLWKRRNVRYQHDKRQPYYPWLREQQAARERHIEQKHQSWGQPDPECKRLMAMLVTRVGIAKREWYELYETLPKEEQSLILTCSDEQLQSFSLQQLRKICGLVQVRVAAIVVFPYTSCHVKLPCCDVGCVGAFKSFT
jgi:hypothetical protein